MGAMARSRAWARLSWPSVGGYIQERLKEEVMRKLSRQVAYVMVSSCMVTGLLSDFAHAQTAKDLVGAWLAVSNVAEQGGVKSEPYGATPQGMLIFEADGRYGLILSRNDLPKFAANSRTKGTPDENKAVVQGSISHFGRYTVNPADKHVPQFQWAGAEAKLRAGRR
jgi:hypothetical protein